MTNMKGSPGLASGLHGSIMCIEVIICCNWNRASFLLMEQNINLKEILVHFICNAHFRWP